MVHLDAFHTKPKGGGEMSRETRDKGRAPSAPARSQKPVIAPGKDTLTMGMRHAGAVQRKAGPAPLPAWEGAMAATNPAKSSATLTDDVWTDAAHRGGRHYRARSARGARQRPSPGSSKVLSRIVASRR